MTEPRRPSRRSRVPSGRIERFARLGWLAGEIALGGAAEGLRRLGGSDASSTSAFLTGSNAERLARSLSTMRGAAMKMGQMLSMEAEDLLPAEVADALAVLRAEGDAMPVEQLHGVLERAWGAGWQERFREFDDTPIAAASIGQVHEGTTRDGRKLALKIQYPGVADSIDSDVDNLAAALRVARVLPGQIDFDPIIREVKRQLKREADYRREARYLTRYGVLLEDEPGVTVPRVHEDFTSSRVLAMDRLNGLPLEDLSGAGHSQEARDRAGTLLLRLLLRELFEFRFMQTDPNFANYLWLEDERIALLDLGAGQEISKQLSQGYARLFSAAASNDRDALRAAALQIGFVDASDPEDQTEAMVDLIDLATEPFRQDGPYPFDTSDLPARAREAGTELVLSHGVWRPPPPATLFLQRKLGGTFLLCGRLRARVDAKALLEEAFARAGL